MEEKSLQEIPPSFGPSDKLLPTFILRWISLDSNYLFSICVPQQTVSPQRQRLSYNSFYLCIWHYAELMVSV
jgi:hypothetical protein